MPADAASLFHILNPSARRRAEVAAFFSGRSWDHVWIERKSHPTHLETAVHWAVNEGRTAIAIWGGDGSLSRAVNALDDLGALDRIQVALVPVGTCNDFARQVGATTFASDRTALSERRVDVAFLEHDGGRRLFVNNAGFGRRPEARRDRRPNAIADILRLRPTVVEVAARGAGTEHRDRFRALMAIVFNAPYFGGGMHFATDIRPDDGALDGFFVRDQSRLRLLASFMGGRAGRAFRNGKTDRFHGAEIDVVSDADLFPQADGETASAGGVKRIRFGVRPGALRLLTAQPL